jgi:hypothetical protein
MGVDTRIALPPSSRIRDVAKVLGKLVGLPHTMEPLGHGSSSYVCDVRGVAVVACSVETLARIEWSGARVPHMERCGVLYHYEGPRGERLMLPRACDEWIEIGRQLVQFFGGTVDFYDCDDVDVDFSRTPAYPDGMPEDGKPWADLQERIAAVRMIRLGNHCPDCGGDPAALCCVGAH